MDPEKHQFRELLLDFHLDQLDDETRAQVQAELLKDPTLRAMSDRVGQVLRPLDHWTLPPVPARLAETVLRRIRQEQDDAANLTPPGATRQSGLRGWYFSLRDVAAIAACILLVFSVLVPGISGVRARSKRAACASHIRAIDQGTSVYQAAFGGWLPFAGHKPGASWLPSALPDHPFASNSRHLFLIVRLGFGPRPEHFICPSSDEAEPMVDEQIERRTDFSSPRNVSYDSLNMAGPTPLAGAGRPIAYLADRNPLFVDGRFDQTIDPNTANSPLHGRTGQNVLMLDGAVEWLTSPIYGLDADNLWLAGNIRRYTGVETQTSDADAFLVPGFPAQDSHAGE